MSWINPKKPKLSDFIAKAEADGRTTLRISDYLSEWTYYKTFWTTAEVGLWALGRRYNTHYVPGQATDSAMKDEPEKHVPWQIGALTKLTELDLSGGGFESVHPCIALESLTTLNLSGNKLEQLPSTIGKLKNLTTLNLSGNPLKELPSWIGDLANLTTLDASSTSLSSLPAEIAGLKNLTTLNLYWNSLTTLPAEIGRLTNLTALDLSSNNLEVLPPEIGQLKKLKTLNLAGTKLTKLPLEMGRLANLQLLSLSGFLGVFGRTEISWPPPEIVAKGTPAILAFLHDLLESGRQEWRAKLVIVGEPRAGKTTLLRRLRGEKFLPDETSTRGIEKRSLKLRHPSSDVQMELNAWDFGGQRIYHATHRYFLTDGALFLLVWDSSRDDHLSGKVEYWLENIRAQAPGARVVLVATHAEDRAPDLREDLDGRYPRMIVGRFAVSNKNDEDQGRANLQEKLRVLAAALPRMGERWPAAWLSAAEALARHTENYVKPSVVRKELTRYGVTEDTAANTLLDWLHERGDILFFRTDPELNDFVLLKPHWVSEMIGRVHDSSAVREAGGVFTLTDRETIWQDLDEAVCAHLLRMMEQFDLSFPTESGRGGPSLVVECLSPAPRPYETEWDNALTGKSARELALSFEMDGSGGERLRILPPGIPSWFIARTHRFGTGTQWRNGAVLADTPDRKHLGLIRAEEGRVRLAVRGPNPYSFFTELRNVLENTLQRYPGLEIRRTVPCPGQNGRRCRHEFSYEALEKLDSRQQPEVDCVDCGTRLPVRRLLYGMDEAVRDGRSQWQADYEAKQAAMHNEILQAVLAGTAESKDIKCQMAKFKVETMAELKKVLEAQKRFHSMANQQVHLFGQLRELARKVEVQNSRSDDRDREFRRFHDDLLRCQRIMQEEFTKMYGRDQAALDASLPRIFILRPTGGRGWLREKIFGQPWELQLYCEHPGAWHPQETGQYHIQQPPRWMRKIAPYLEYLCKGLQASLPVAGFAASVAGPIAAAAGFATSSRAAESARAFADSLEKMQELTELLEHAASIASDASETPDVSEMESEAPSQGHGEILRDFWKLLAELDGSLQPGGLQKVLTRDGGCYWVCDEHVAHSQS